MRKYILAVLLSAVFGIAIAGEPLTETQSLRLGLARPEVLDMASGSLSAAEADALEAGLWSNPTLDYIHDRTNGAPGTLEQIWQINQTLDIAGRRNLKRESGERKVDAVRAGNAARRGQLAATIRRNFFELLRKQESVQAMEAWAQRFAHVDSVIGKLKKSGEISGYDRRRFARERQAAEARLATERSELVRQRERLLALIGRQGAAYDAVAGTLLPDAPPSLDASLTRLAGRPDLRALAHLAEAAELEGKAAARGWIPEVTLGVGTKRVNENSGALIALSIPLPVFDRQQAADYRTAAQAQSARAEYRINQVRAEGELRGLHHQLEQLIAATAQYRQQAVVPSADLVRIAESAYQAGESTILELLDAYKGALEAETTALDLEWKAREARIEFDLLSGSFAE